MATMGMLAAGVAHEVNNPLTAVAGFAEGIKRRLPRLEGKVDDELFEDFKEYTDTILKECDRCQTIVQTLLTFSRPVVSDFMPVSLNRVVNDTIRILQHHFKKHPRLRVSVSLAEVLPMIYGDEAQLKQVALNLLTNAVDAIGEKGELCVATTLFEGGVRMAVSDTGCGIPEKNLDKLFDPFFTTKPVGKGIGIGLATCYHIVRDHGGEISVNSDLGLGTCFAVTLPLRQRDHNE
jgi:signal transduction histidine kinase